MGELLFFLLYIFPVILATLEASKSLSAKRTDEPSFQRVKFMDPSLECKVDWVPRLCVSKSLPIADFFPLISLGTQLTLGVPKRNKTQDCGSLTVLKRVTRHSEDEPFFFLPYALCHMQSSWTIECRISSACCAVGTVAKKGAHQCETLTIIMHFLESVIPDTYYSIKAEAVRCYRCVHNSVDIHNQLAAYGNWDYRTRRKQMRVPICFPRICRLEILAYS